jgi:hypothetical protein
MGGKESDLGKEETTTKEEVILEKYFKDPSLSVSIAALGTIFLKTPFTSGTQSSVNHPSIQTILQTQTLLHSYSFIHSFILRFIHSMLRPIFWIDLNLYILGHSLSRIHFHCSKYHIVAIRLPPLSSQTKQQKQIGGFFSWNDGKISAAAGTLTATLHVRFSLLISLSIPSFLFPKILLVTRFVSFCFVFMNYLFDALSTMTTMISQLIVSTFNRHAIIAMSHSLELTRQNFFL